MTTPILITKLFVPPTRSQMVSRPRLLAQMDEGQYRSLTLISAPAGFGKTSLVSAWIAQNQHPTAWLSLDEEDSDPARFMAYLISALRAVAPEISTAVVTKPHLSQPPPAELILTALLNDITVLQQPILLVLDDYHRIHSSEVNQAVAFLIEYMPSHMHLVITTREDPPLPLARLRARGQMNELRASDLRFTADEAAAFMNDVMGLNLSLRDVAILETRTEGWIAGLQLAALSIHGHTDLTGFIEAFAGNDRYIVDYLVEEVLQRQPQHLREFLLQTSILDQLSGPLCNAVTGQEGSQKLLESLDHNNLFVVPLDEKRHWYRFHHLFSEVLQAFLADEHPDLVPVLHLRASQWFQQHGMVTDAVRHALAAQDFGRAADLVATAMPSLSRSRQEVTVLGWLKAIPDDIIRARPVLSVDYAGILMQTGGDLNAIESRLEDAQQWLHPTQDTATNRKEMVIGDDDYFHRLPGQISIYRAGVALMRGDIAGTIQHATQATELLPDQDDFGHGAASGLLGLAHWSSGDLEAGHRLYTECMARLLRANFVSDTFGCALVLADIRITQGRLHEAMSTFGRALQLAAKHDAASLRGIPDMHVGMSSLYLERNDIDAAIHHLQVSKGLGEHSGLPQNPYRWNVAMARQREAQGDLEGALALLREAEGVYVGDFSPNVRPVSAITARMLVACGKLGEALVWVREHGLTTQDDLNYLQEYEHITLARILLARDELPTEETLGLLERLLQAADKGGRTGSVIEIMTLQACAYAAQGDIPGALVPLEQALKLAEPEGYTRIFINEGAPVARLLTEANTRGIMPDYTGKLLSAGGWGDQVQQDLQPVSTIQSLDDLLSQREIEVIRLIGQGLSNKEISETLFLALDTVKGHNRNIFRKLGGQNRTEAVALARAIGIL